ncbi:MAG: hydroxymethylglutaryl-CoA lyase, partial [Saprospiraceae bacterium]|nr:hydroxymethylglutaryl-CoA lyase [Saprospiraceae bacterium]
EIGAHFHTQPHNWEEKIASYYHHGCRRFDGELPGYGGCPMARDTLTGNMPTENMIGYLDEQGVCPELDREVLREAMDMAAEIFP